MRKLTTEEFIKRSSVIHHDIYDYSKIIYTGALNKIIVICRIHGEFIQTPHHHLEGTGCKQCIFDAQKLSIDEFIIRANKIHNNIYDYSISKYISYHVPIDIVCNLHGEFPQSPAAHLGGQGCPTCGIEKCAQANRSSTQEFIYKANLCHKEKYNYSKTNYFNSTTPVIIICYLHGEFEQIPASHINGSGCDECGKILSSHKRKYSCEEFIEKANIIHNYRYDYSQSIYIDIKTELDIICIKHGLFKQTPDKHIQGSGCTLCGYEENSKRKKSNIDEFIIKANIIHNNKYDYSKFIYLGSEIKGIIICPIHKEFEQMPNKHISAGHGCPNCSHIISKPEIQWLDQLNIPNDPEHRQVSLKVNRKRFRVDGFDPLTNIVYEFYGDYFHGNPALFPSDAINNTVKKTFGELYQKKL